MSRHWHNIKDGKAKLDSRRAAKFTMYGRMITMAAREKGGDPAMNPKLRSIIEKAKEHFTPRDVIDRAIKKGTGELASEALEELVYEGYGPGGAAILVETVTDNRNRTAGNIKNYFNKGGGSLGAQNSVAWMFEKKGVITLPKAAYEGKDADEVSLQMVEFGAEDVRIEDEGMTIVTLPDDVQKVKDAMVAAGFVPDASDTELLAKDSVAFDAARHEGLETLIETIENDEDVKNVFTNVNL